MKFKKDTMLELYFDESYIKNRFAFLSKDPNLFGSSIYSLYLNKNGFVYYIDPINFELNGWDLYKSFEKYMKAGTVKKI